VILKKLKKTVPEPEKDERKENRKTTKPEPKEDEDRKPEKENKKTSRQEAKEMKDEERELTKEEQRKENRKTSIDPDRKDYRKPAKQGSAGQLGLPEEKLEKLEKLEAAHRLRAKNGKTTINATLIDENDKKPNKNEKDSSEESEDEDEEVPADTNSPVIGYNLKIFGRKEIVSNKDNQSVAFIDKEWHPSKPFFIGRTQFKKLPGEIAVRMSRKHFEINCRVSNKTGKRHFILTDTSGNGTYINGKIVGNGNSKVLKNNDRIDIVLTKESKEVEIGYEFEISTE